ncbi:hypothetical protein BDA96_04G079200 [Sorghum bicolor]|uniref:Knottin scorpion toxin-like domain-containing protein n=2 Tax=Sorghum bicolor TaxID=4558 RepID=A0A921R3Q5_SORBI|nr:hypothetical protein BDA96_04G079200 [Sorghum bicolor]OQU84538.1 hypothetical protein SORBI_3004G072950 [Sorghum bicolor]
MTHLGKNLSTAVLLIVIVAAVCSMPAYACSKCGHLSSSYHGLCWSEDNSVDCNNACEGESSENVHGRCFWFKCCCYTC